MARRTPTAEQRQHAAERRGRFRALAAQVAEMSDDERAALVMRVGAIVTCEGRALSPFNSCLVLSQLPTASMVGGFWQWKDKGRAVRKGARGLMIWIPKHRGDASEEAPPVTDASGGESEEKAKRSSFVTGTVFDVSQTEPERGATDRQGTDELARGAAYADGF